MNLIDHVLNIRILIHRALEAQMERSGISAAEREEKLKPCVFTLQPLGCYQAYGAERTVPRNHQTAC